MSSDLDIFKLSKAGTRQPADELRLSKGLILGAEVTASQPDGRAIVKIGPRLLPAIMSQYVEPGRKVKMEVLETRPDLILRLLDHKSSPSKSTVGQQFRTTTSPNQIPEPVLRAKILEISTSGKIRIRLTGLSAAAKNRSGGPPLKPGRELIARLQMNQAGTALKTGQELDFTISKTHPQLVLRVLDPVSPPRLPPAQDLVLFLNQPDSLPQAGITAFKAVAETVDWPLSLKDAVADLSQWLFDLSPRPEAVDHEFPERMARALGLSGKRVEIQEAVTRFFSQLLQPKLQELLQDSQVLRRLLESSARLFETADNLKNLNQITWRHDQSLLFSFPLFWGDPPGRGELLFRKDEKKDRPSDSHPIQVSFLLFLSRLGRIKADLTIKKNQVIGAMWLEDEKIRDLVKHSLPRLLSALEARGFEKAELSTHVFPPALPLPETLAQELLPESDPSLPGRGLIDLKV